LDRSLLIPSPLISPRSPLFACGAGPDEKRGEKNLGREEGRGTAGRLRFFLLVLPIYAGGREKRITSAREKRKKKGERRKKGRGEAGAFRLRLFFLPSLLSAPIFGAKKAEIRKREKKKRCEEEEKRKRKEGGS